MLEVIIIEYNEITLLVLRYFDESKERTPIYFCRQTSKRCKKSTFVDLFLRVLRGELFLEGKICVVRGQGMLPQSLRPFLKRRKS